jgi:hypothetical protein
MAFSNRWQRRRGTSDPFTDLLFNGLLGFTYLFLVAFLFVNPVAKQGIIDPKAEYIIAVTWADNNPDDIDTWVEDPEGHLVWFRDREAGLVHLDRDDRGQANDTVTVDGKEIVNPLNQEVVTIRGVVPGEYVVNLHYYATVTRAPVQVGVKVMKVNPALEIVYYGEVILYQRGDDRRAVRRTADRGGSIENLNSMQKKLVRL